MGRALGITPYPTRHQFSETLNTTESTRRAEPFHSECIKMLEINQEEKTFIPRLKHISCISLSEVSIYWAQVSLDSPCCFSPLLVNLCICLCTATPVTPAMKTTGFKPDGKNNSKVTWVQR